MSVIAALRSLFSFPLLTKELTERAARPRTYWLRVGAALLLYGGFWFNNDHVLKLGTIDTFAVLGAGRKMFEVTVMSLFACIAAFVPAMLCGVITHEKERDSLVLLLLTRMRPWQIVLQKYLGGLVPALTLLFLAMPLVAIAYAYGGVATRQTGTALIVLVLAIFQVGAIATWASCRFRTTVAAFLAAYLVGAALFLLPALVVEIDKEFRLDLIDREYRWIAGVHFPPVVFFESNDEWKAFNARRFTISCLSIVATTLVFLLAAIRQLPRRAFARPQHRLRRIFAAIDRWAHRVNQRFGGVTFGRKEECLPGELPIVWREKRARALARPEYLVRLLVVIMIPVVLFGVLFGAGSGEQEGLSVMAAILGGLALLALSATAANGIVDERVNQTFEVLLTTPMTATHILQQKARALRPFLVMLAVPILVVCTIEFVTESTWLESRWEAAPQPEWIYPACILLTAAIYFPLFSWFSIWMGLWCKTRIRAIATTLVVLMMWFAAPIFIADELGIGHSHGDRLRYVYLLTPVWVPAHNEFSELDRIEPNAPWVPVLLNSIIYGGILLAIRRHCLRRADWYLRR